VIADEDELLRALEERDEERRFDCLGGLIDYDGMKVKLLLLQHSSQPLMSSPNQTRNNHIRRPQDFPPHY